MHKAQQTNSIISSQKNLAIKGETSIAPDKSISHRSLIFAALANGKSKIINLLEGEDVLCTAAALRQMGVEINKNQNKEQGGIWEINGVGIAGLSAPDNIFDMGNSGTSTRLLMGLVSSFDFISFFSGDASLRKRPMARVIEPLKQIGAQIIARNKNLLPLAIIGAHEPLPITYQMKMASAQVKSAILLAALNIIGTTTIIEPEKCRDHSEIMMRYLGLKINSQDIEINGGVGTKITFNGGQDFAAKDFTIPGDISSAAFIIVAALIIPNSQIKINNVGINPLRSGIITSLIEMGGNIKLQNQHLVGGEMIADLLVESSKLKGVDIPAGRAPIMIDEYPILAIAAAHAEGITKMKGLAELKVKESNRLDAIAVGLRACGVEVKIGDDDLEIKGGFKMPRELVKIETNLDHRIAMSFLIMGFGLENGLEIDDCTTIKTSFPNFMELFASFGAEFI